MVGLDLEAEPKFVIAKGSEVEVSSDEEGFKGAWYRATLEEAPTKSKRKKLLVRYSTLVKEDGSTPLTESVDPAFIRPLPPVEDMSAGVIFDEGDVIDACYRDGWWTGVVRKKLENGRYIVCFDNPPDVIEFDGKDFRSHLDWSDGKWVRPEKQQSTESMFSPGTAVEVRLENEKMQNIWVPALVIKKNEDDTFFVKSKSMRNSDDADTMKMVVDALCIRPTPPSPCNDIAYDLLAHVEAVDELGWRAGVIHKLLAGKRYTVSFMPANVLKEFDHSEIRPCMDWNNGMWQPREKIQDMILSKHQTKSCHINNGTDGSKQTVGVKKSPRAVQHKPGERTPSARIRKKWGDRTASFSESYAVSSSKKVKLTVSIDAAKQSTPAKLSKRENAAEDQDYISTDGSSKVRNEQQAQHNLCTPTAKSTRRRGVEPAASETPLREIAARKKQQLTGHLSNKIADDATNVKLPARSPRLMLVSRLKATVPKETQGKATPKKPSKLTKDLKDSTKALAVEEEIKEQKTESSSRRKRGRPRKFVSPELPQAVQDVSEQKAAGASNDRKVRKVERTLAEDIDNLADDDQPLATWIGGSLHTGAEELRQSSARNTVSDVGEKQIVESPKEDTSQVLPFVKRSPIWKTIESMEVFRIVPQRPHFIPLLETKEEYREGSAIGLMITFSGLFDKVVNLRFDDPRSTYDSIIESLHDLEKHGFDVTAAKSRINELLSIKDSQRQMLDESNSLEREIMEKENKRRRCEEDIESITLKILELRDQQATVEKLKDSIDLEIAKLQSHSATLNQKIQNVEHEFQKTATATWKSV